MVVVFQIKRLDTMSIRFEDKISENLLFLETIDIFHLIIIHSI